MVRIRLLGQMLKLLKAIADELGVKVKFSEMSFDNVLANVQSGKADIAISESQLLKNVKKSLISQILTMSLKRFLLSKKDATGTYKQTGDFAKKICSRSKKVLFKKILPKQTCQMLMWYPWHNLVKLSMS